MTIYEKAQEKLRALGFDSYLAPGIIRISMDRNHPGVREDPCLYQAWVYYGGDKETAWKYLRANMEMFSLTGNPQVQQLQQFFEVTAERQTA